MDFKTAVFTIKKYEEGKYKVVLTKERIDRDGEIIDIASANIDNFKRNPVMAWGHRAVGGDVYDIVGEWVNIQKEVDYDQKLMITAEPRWASHQKAQDIRQMAEDGILKTVSIGFMGGSYDPTNQKVSGIEIFETSWVGVPSNIDAEVRKKSVSETEYQKTMLKKLANYDDIKPKIKLVRELFLDNDFCKQIGYEKTGNELLDYKNLFDLIKGQIPPKNLEKAAENLPEPKKVSKEDLYKILFNR